MATLLWICAAYIVLDRLITIAWIDRSIEITRGLAVFSVITGVGFVYVLLRAAILGVTP